MQFAKVEFQEIFFLFNHFKGFISEFLLICTGLRTKQVAPTYGLVDGVEGCVTVATVRCPVRTQFRAQEIIFSPHLGYAGHAHAVWALGEAWPVGLCGVRERWRNGSTCGTLGKKK